MDQQPPKPSKAKPSKPEEQLPPVEQMDPQRKEPISLRQVDQFQKNISDAKKTVVVRPRRLDPHLR